MCIASPSVKGEGTGEGKEPDSGGANCVQSRTWRNAGRPTGKYRFREVQGAAGTRMVNSSRCYRDPARNLEQGPEGPETPIQVVLR